MRCGNAGECLHQQLQVSRIDVKCLRLLTVTLVEKCYKIQRTDWKPVLHRVCAGKKGLNSALQPLVHGSCSCGGSRTCSGLYRSVCQGSRCQVLLLRLRTVLFAAHLASSHTYTPSACRCRQFKPLLCYAFRGHAF